MSLINFEHTIMVVDDDPDVLELLGIRINLLFSWEVIKESNAMDALETLGKRDIPIVITDINMPDMNGVDLLKNIKSLLKGTQVIVMTAGTSTINCIDCFRHGATDFLVKPFSEEDVKKVLNNAMERIERWKQFIQHRKVGEGFVWR
ncbi:MAG: response regulator [Nitrospinae bacterium]|nr:response regulator [Nitrospinota bacterium]